MLNNDTFCNTYTHTIQKIFKVEYSWPNCRMIKKISKVEYSWPNCRMIKKIFKVEYSWPKCRMTKKPTFIKNVKQQLLLLSM